MMMKIMTKCNDTCRLIDGRAALRGEIISVSISISKQTKQIVGEFCRHLVNVNPNW